MIYFLHGPDTYRSRQKVREIVFAFQERAGDPAFSGIGLARVDAADDPSAVFTVGRTASLFAEKELVIIENASAAPAAVITHLAGELPRWKADRNVTVIFWEGEVAPGGSAFAEAVKKAATKAQAFALLAPAAAGRWLGDEARRRGLALSVDEKRMLVAAHGSDLWALANELDKIRDGWSERRAAGAAAVVWDFTDAFLRQPRQAFGPLARLLDEGYDPVHLLASLAGALRATALVWKGLASGKLETLTSRLHPFVVRKNMGIARRLDAASLRERFAGLLRADAELKTGRLPLPLPLVKLTLTKEGDKKSAGR